MPHPNHVPFLGRLLRAQYDCSQEPLPQNLEILLCFLDGAERRRQVQRKLNSWDQQMVKLGLPADVHWMPADEISQAGTDCYGNERHFDSLRQAVGFVMEELTIADRANVCITTKEANLTIEQIEKLAA